MCSALRHRRDTSLVALIMRLLETNKWCRDRNRTGTPVIHEAADFKSRHISLEHNHAQRNTLISLAFVVLRCVA